jgi:anti-sigma regulatory factor (Ser/Thr protein kinase)
MPQSGFEPTLDRAIECTPRAPAEARRALEQLDRDVDSSLLRDLQLIVSELVTNSVRHSGSGEPLRLRAWWRPSGLKVEVADGGTGFEADAGGRGDSAEGGRGLLILDRLAERWGVANDTRNRVWFEVALSPSRAPRGLTQRAS